MAFYILNFIVCWHNIPSLAFRFKLLIVLVAGGSIIETTNRANFNGVKTILVDDRHLIERVEAANRQYATTNVVLKVSREITISLSAFSKWILCLLGKRCCYFQSHIKSHRGPFKCPICKKKKRLQNWSQVGKTHQDRTQGWRWSFCGPCYCNGIHYFVVGATATVKGEEVSITTLATRSSSQ